MIFIYPFRSISSQILNWGPSSSFDKELIAQLEVARFLTVDPSLIIGKKKFKKSHS